MEVQVNILAFPSLTRANFAILLSAVLLTSFTTTLYVLDQIGNRPTGSDLITFMSGSVGTLAISIGALFYYAIHPIFRERSFGPSEEVVNSDPIEVRVSYICDRLALQTPRLLIDADIRNRNAIVFGCRSKTILMGRGLRYLLAARPDEFDVRIAHELGHLKNGDVSITFLARGLILSAAVYLTLSFFIIIYFDLAEAAEIWREWTNGGASTLSILAAWSGYFKEIVIFRLGDVLKPLLLASILFAYHQSFLRLREYYADQVAAAFSGDLAAKAAIGPEPLSPSVRKNLSLPLDAHPTNSRRIFAIDSPATLFRPSVIDLLLFGCVMGLMTSTFETIPVGENFSGTRNIEEVAATLSNAGVTLYIFALFALSVGLVPVYALASLGMQLATFAFFSSESIPKRIVSASLYTCVFFLFSLIGCVLNPTSIDQFFKYQIDVSYLVPSDYEINVSLVYMYFLSSFVIFYFLLLRRFTTSQKITPPGKIFYFSIGVIIYFAANYLLCSALFLFLEKFNISVGRTLSAVCFAMAAIAMYIGYILSRRTLSPRFMGYGVFSPWVWRNALLQK
ncbi:M48 family metalloprotease [Rhizobium alvei]|uniref:M48 family metalloprotease n=1 Tax=Rhizobium alvei TaxID=1132659 RepID=A0ABT8YTN3_9HYPH|nr:M48 family metalloprotease [Rhizobium alvei]MDO6967122.1 M48 family metalloprotease [Rhizobium alvei]